MRWLLTVLAALAATSAIGDELPHRDDFRMNSISGGDFRQYVLEHIVEDDGWAHSQQTLGVLHNHMHETMTELARYGRETGDAEAVPDFNRRLSGGQWSDYLAALEDRDGDRRWHALVQLTDIMHDRVHHMMVSAVLYDVASRQREVDLDALLADRMTFDQTETLPERDLDGPPPITGQAFRKAVWSTEFDHPHLHAAMQYMAAFDVLMDDVMTQLAQYGMAKADETCRPPRLTSRMTREDWTAYVDRVTACEDEAWQHLVIVAGRARERLSQTMAALLQYSDVETPVTRSVAGPH